MALVSSKSGLPVCLGGFKYCSARKRKTSALSIAIASAAAASGLLYSGTDAQAQTYVKAANNTTIDMAASWLVGGVAATTPPGPTNICEWSSTATATGDTVGVGAGVSIGEIQLANNVAGGVTVSAGTGSLTLNGIGGLGIDMSVANQNLTIAAPITLANNVAFNLANGRTLTISGILSGGATGLTLNGAATFAFSGALDTYTGTTTVNGATLNLIFNTANNDLSNSSSLALGGATMNFGNNIANTTNTQSFTGTSVTAGATTLTQGRISGGKVITNLGTLTRSGVGGTIVIFPTSNSSLFSTSSASVSGIVGGWATFNGTDFVKGATTAGTTTTIAAPTYVSDTWAAANNTNVTLASNTQTSATTNSLRFAVAATADTVTLSGTNIINSGGILVSSAVTAGDTITGGTLEGAASSDLVINHFGTGTLAINSVIADNTSATALTKSGTGYLTLGGNNTFTGGIFINQGNIGLTSGGSLNGNAINFDNNSSSAVFLGGVNANAASLSTTSVVNSTVPSIQDANATSAVLTLSGSGTTTFAGSVLNGSGGGSLGLAKTGSGTQNLTGVLTYTGPTTVSNGTLAVTRTIASSTNISVVGSGVLDVSAVPGLTLGSGNTLSGSGTVIGSVTVPAGAIVTPGVAGVGTLSINGLLTLSSATSTLNFNLSSGSPTASSSVNSLINTANLNISGGQFNLVGLGAATTGSVFDLIHYTGLENGSPAALTVASGGTGGLTYTFGLDTVNQFVTLTVGGSAANNSTWSQPGGGSWALNTNWNPALVPTNPGDTANFGSSITAPSTITLDGSYSVGVLTFANSNAYTIAQGTGGSLTFDNGAGSASLTDSQGSHFITAPVILNSSTIVTVANSGDVMTISGSISGVGALTVSGAGTLALAAANTFTGGVNLNGGIVNFVSGALGSTGGINFGGGTLQYATGNTDDISARTLTFGGQAVIDTNGNNVTFANGIGNAGTGGLTKIGAGTLTLSAGSTYTGSNIINAGTLNISADTALGAVPAAAATNLTINSGATLQAGGAFTLSANRGVALGGGTDTIDTNGNALTIAGALSGSGLLHKIGAGVLTLTGGSSGTGGTTIDAGTIAVFNQTDLPTGSFTLNGTAGITTTTTSSFSGVVVNGTNFITSTSNTTIQGLGQVTGAGTLVFGGGYVNDLTGDLTAFTGTITPNVIGYRLNGTTGGNNFTFNLSSGTAGASVRSTTTAITFGQLLGGPNTFLSGSAGGATQAVTYTIGGKTVAGVPVDSTFSGVISNGVGTTSITKVGASRLFLNGAGNTYSGITNISGGTLNINSGYALGGANYGGLIISGGTLQYSNPLLNATTDVTFNGTARPVTFGPAGATIDTNGNAISFASPAGNGGTGGLTVADSLGNGSLTMDAVNTYSGRTIINTGATLQLGDGTAGHDGTIATSSGITNNGTLIYNRNGAQSSAINISGLGTVAVTGTGSQTLAGVNNYSGGTSVTGGTLIAGSTNGLSPNSAFTVTSGTLDASGFNSTISSLSIASSGVLNLSTGALLTVTGAANFASGSTLYVLNPSGAAPTVPDELIAFSTAGGTTFSNVILAGSIPSGDALSYTPTALFLISTSTGPATLTWNNTGGTGDGVTWDTVQKNFNAASGAVAYSDTSNGSTGDIVTFNDNNNSHYNVTISGVLHPTSVTFANTVGNYNVSAANSSSGLAGPGSLNLTGTGSVTLAGNNTYTGGTNVSSGKLVLGSAKAYPLNSPLTLAAGATIDVASYNLAIQNGSIGAITASVKAAYNSGAWNGTNSSIGVITSSVAAGDSAHLTAVGVATGLTTFEGSTVPGTDVLVKLTYYGDADLSGTVDGSDYSRIDNGFLTGLTGWQNGDFNYDGVVDGSDYTLIDNAFNTQGANIAAQVASPTAQIAGGASAAVPEPTTLGLLGISAIGLLGRRRADRHS